MAETITLLPDPIDVDTPFGKALCLAWYDYGFWTETQWMCATLNGGQIVFVPHQDIRFTNHYSARLTSSSPPEKPAYMAKVGKKPKPDDGYGPGFGPDFGEPMHLPEEDGA